MIYDTLTEALKQLEKKGYGKEFHLLGDCLSSYESKKKYNPNDFDIKEVHRFEGMSDPSDNAVLYAIESKDGEKGVLLHAYGTYSEEVSTEMMQKLNRRN